MKTTNGMMAISQFMDEMNQSMMGKTDWGDGWDKESWTDNWRDSHK